MNMQSSPTPISPETAKNDYGVFTNHERMPNGELRFRLMSMSGSGYIRTIAVSGSGWQKSHWHRHVKETYVVQDGWMILVSMRARRPIFERVGPGNAVTTEPKVPHTIYLPDGAVIHTIKSGDTREKDWEPCPELDAMTERLSGKEAMAKAQITAKSKIELDPRFDTYVTIYNNFDSLIWKLPSFFVAAIGLMSGFVVNMLSQGRGLSPLISSVLFISVGLFSLLGAYSMWRIRVHHTRMGEQLRKMEPDGYFHVRSQDVARWFPPSAPAVFIFIFVLVGISLVTMGVLAAKEYAPLVKVLQAEFKAG